MAGLILELISKEDEDIKVKVIPGVTASIGAAAILERLLCMISVI